MLNVWRCIKYLSHVLHILKWIKWKWNAKFSNVVDGCYLCYYFFVVLCILLYCPAQVHTIKNGDIYLKCNCVIVETILLSAMGVFVFRFCFIIYFSSPSNKHRPSIEPKHTSFFPPYIYFEYAFSVRNKAYEKQRNKNGKYCRHTRTLSKISSHI